MPYWMVVSAVRRRDAQEFRREERLIMVGVGSAAVLFTCLEPQCVCVPTRGFSLVDEKEVAKVLRFTWKEIMWEPGIGRRRKLG